jgi:uncharacterized protein YndB with AHSA1/START domain
VNDTAREARLEKIVVDETFPHAPEIIWRTLTDGELIGRWLGMAPKGFEPVIGNHFTFQTTPAGPWDGSIHCEVLEAARNQRFAFSWQGGHRDNSGYGSPLDTVVTFTLEEAGGGTRLRLVHSGFVLPRNDTTYKNMSGGWAHVVPRIGTLATENSQDA